MEKILPLSLQNFHIKSNSQNWRFREYLTEVSGIEGHSDRVGGIRSGTGTATVNTHYGNKATGYLEL